MLLPDGFAVHVAFVAAERAGLTVVGIGHRAGDAEIRHLLTQDRCHRDRHPASSDGRPPARTGRDAQPPAAPSPTTSWSTTTAPRTEAHAAVDAIAARAFGADDLFLVNSTSGTTGLPKCVVHNQNRWMFFHQLAADAGDLTTDDVFFSALPAPFGFGLWTSHVTPAVLGVHHRRAGTLRRRRRCSRRSSGSG